MKSQDWKLTKIKAIKAYFKRYERGRAVQIQGYIINNVKTTTGLGVRNAAMSTAEIGQLLRQNRFTRNNDGSWSLPGKRPAVAEKEYLEPDPVILYEKASTDQWDDWEPGADY